MGAGTWRWLVISSLCIQRTDLLPVICDYKNDRNTIKKMAYKTYMDQRNRVHLCATLNQHLQTGKSDCYLYKLYVFIKAIIKKLKLMTIYYLDLPCAWGVFLPITLNNLPLNRICNTLHVFSVK